MHYIFNCQTVSFIDNEPRDYNDYQMLMTLQVEMLN